MASSNATSDGERDRELIKKVLQGDKQAFQVLVEQYQARLYRLIYQIVRNEEDAKDVTQEAFVKIYLSLTDFRGQSSFFTWAYRITFNLAIDWKRKYSRIAAKTDSQSNEITESLVEQIPSDAHRQDEVIHQQEQRRAINEALAAMTPEQRSIVVLRDVDGLSYDEISDATGLPKGTVMSRLFYGRKKLMELLATFRMKEQADTSNTPERLSPEREGRGSDSVKNERFQSVGGISLRPLKNG